MTDTTGLAGSARAWGRGLVFVAALGLAACPAAAQDAAGLAPRMSALEDQMRQIVGQIEQLGIQVRQISQQVQRMQADNEFRFQQLEAGKKPATAVNVQAPAPAPAPAPTPAPVQGQGAGAVAGQTDTLDLSAYQTGALDQQAAAGAPVQPAPGPQILGTIPATGDVQAGAPAGQPQQPVAGDAQTAAAADPNTPEGLYELSYEKLLRGRFPDAAGGFQSFLSRFPDNALAGNAQYWLGETYYAQSDFKQAAQSFLKGYQTYPKSVKAPDSLVKLGMSLKQLGQKQQACAVLATVGSKYPKAADANKRAQAELKRGGC